MPGFDIWRWLFKFHKTDYSVKGLDSTSHDFFNKLGDLLHVSPFLRTDVEVHVSLFFPQRSLCVTFFLTRCSMCHFFFYQMAGWSMCHCFPVNSVNWLSSASDTSVSTNWLGGLCVSFLYKLTSSPSDTSFSVNWLGGLCFTSFFLKTVWVVIRIVKSFY